MSCLLCAIWSALPYEKRHSTPVSPQEVEGVLVIGYWHGKQRQAKPGVQAICERHMAIMEQLDVQEMVLEASTRKTEPATPPAMLAAADEFKRRAEAAALQANPPEPPPQPLPPPPPILPYMARPAPAAPAAPAAPPAQPRLAVPTAPPVPPVAAPLIIPGVTATPPGTQPSGTTTVTVADGKPRFPCPVCGKPTFSGDVHVCG